MLVLLSVMLLLIVVVLLLLVLLLLLLRVVWTVGMRAGGRASGGVQESSLSRHGSSEWRRV